jgi:hypothetical protein
MAKRKHYRVKGTDEVYPEIATEGDQIQVQLAENTVGWYHVDQLTECEAPTETIAERDRVEAP